MLPHTSRTVAAGPRATGGIPVKYRPLPVGLALYDLRHDPGETRDVAAVHPEEVTRLLAFAEEARQDMGDALTARKGSGLREPGRVP